MVADGSTLAFTVARYGGQDHLDRPLLATDYVRIDLSAGSALPPVRVPGYVGAASGADLFTVEDAWGEHWSVSSHVVAVRIAAGVAEVQDRLELPPGAYDLRAAGATLFFSTDGGRIAPMADVLGGPDYLLTESRLGTVRLGMALVPGPQIGGGTAAFCSLLLPEDGAALAVRDGLLAERWDLTGELAQLSWASSLPAYPLHARADSARIGHYLLALGYAGGVSLPD